MEILLVSDNHGLIKPIDYVLEKHNHIACKIHCGDFELQLSDLKDFKLVKGNNDYGDVPNYFIIEKGNYNILITHGHPYASVYSLSNLVLFAKDKGCNVVFFGHTHIFCDTEIDGVRLINPGSLSHNRDGSNPSYAIVSFKGNEIIVKKHELM